MITIPVYDMIILPGITYYFKKDVFQELSIKDAQKGDEVLFLFMKEDRTREEMKEDDFYPIGIMGTYQGNDENGNISVKTTTSVDVRELTERCSFKVCSGISMGSYGKRLYSSLENDGGSCFFSCRLFKSYQ